MRIPLRSGGFTPNGRGVGETTLAGTPCCWPSGVGDVTEAGTPWLNSCASADCRKNAESKPRTKMDRNLYATCPLPAGLLTLLLIFYDNPLPPGVTLSFVPRP